MPYWDTSRILKLYVTEADTQLFNLYALGRSGMVTSELTRLELFAAFHRKEAAGLLRFGGAGQLIAKYDSDLSLGRVMVKPTEPAVFAKFESIVAQCYRQPIAIQLRTLDGTHLATAAHAGEVELVATDARLRDAAVQLGFSVFPAP